MVAQAFATLSLFAPGRVYLGVELGVQRMSMTPLGHDDGESFNGP